MALNDALLAQLLGGGGGESQSMDPISQIFANRPTVASNPFGIGASSLMQGIPGLSSPYASPGRNITATLGAGLLAAILGGVAKGQTQSDSAEYMRSARDLLSADSPQRISATLAQEPRLESAAIALEMQQKAAEQKRAEEALKAQREIETAYGKREAMLPLFEQETQIRGKYNPSGTKVSVNTGETNPYAAFGKEFIGKAAESKGFIGEARNLASELEKGPQDSIASWAGYQGARSFSGLDKDGVGILIKNTMDRLSRARTGAALNASEEKLYKEMVGGDFSAGPQQAAKLLRKLVAAEARVAKSNMDFGTNIIEGNVSNIRAELDRAIKEGQVSEAPPPPRQPGETVEQYRARTGR